MASQTPLLALLSTALYFSVTRMKIYNIPSTLYKGSLLGVPSNRKPYGQISQ